MLQINSFRHRLMILFTTMAFILGMSCVLYVGHLASAQMTQASGQTLYVAAKNIANTFAEHLTEREREITLLAKSPFFQEAQFDWPELQTKLDQVQESYRYYAWLGIATPEGKVALAGKGLLAGEDVASRPWFNAALNKTYVGDVHKAVLLAKKVKAINPNEPLRLIDFATPIYDKNQQLKGVLAAHADWSWAKEALERSLPEHAAEDGIEVFIVNAKGEILYPFKSIGQVTPPDFQGKTRHFYEHQWSEEQKYLTTDVPIVAETAMDLGWHVLVRQPKAQALAEVRHLQHQILLMGFIISLLLLWVTYRLAQRFSQPIEQLAAAAHLVEQGSSASFEQKTSIHEIQTLSQSLSSMTQTLLSQKNQLLEANATLEEKVALRTAALQQANATLEKLARFDELTNVYNRRAVNEYLHYLFTQFQRNAQSYSVLLLDVDFFKQVNDQFGHEVGDQVLQKVATTILEQVRETDFVARFGGEEFIIVAPQTDLEGAGVVADKVRQAIAQAELMAQRPVTVSIGVSEVLTVDQDIQDSIRRADAGLYQAKTYGRNQVVMVKD